VRSKAEYEKELGIRTGKAAEREIWQNFIKRLREEKYDDDDKRRITPIEDFCLGKISGCPILKELAVQETPEHAHSLLLKLGYWDYAKNPYPARLGFPETISYPSLDPLPQEKRLDLTHLDAYAIDDEGNTDPDDALSMDGFTLWIHVADIAAVVKPGSEPDIHARGMAA
jgi:exoribonuclease-2